MTTLSELEMPLAEHVLTGFDDFLERRRVAFMEPLPATRICSACRLVPSHSLLLPCGHVLCRICKGQIGEEARCPFDGRVFADTAVVPLNFRQSDIEQLRVRCIAGGNNCSFAGKLCELKHHLALCVADEVKCSGCGEALVRSVAVHHHRQCTGGIIARQVVSDEDVKRIVDGLGEIKTNLDRLRLRGAGDQFDNDSVANDANTLFERVVTLERELACVGERTSPSQGACALQLTKRAPISHGPFRAASKPGAFVILRTFTEVQYAHDGAKGGTNAVTLTTEVCVLAGYSFKLECKLAKDQRDEVHLWFVLCLCSGPWDTLLKWPFLKKVTVILTHPTFLKGDIRLPMCMEDHGVVKKPTLNTPNMGSCTEKVPWMAVELNGFIDNKNLYANVEFE